MTKKLMVVALLAITLTTTVAPITVQAYSAGWQKTNGQWWYATSNKSWHANKWVNISGKWYHFKPNGYMTTGWLKSGNNWYYLKGGNDGSMATGWLKSGNNWYYLRGGNDGRMVTGWVQDNGKWYYMSTSGAMVANGWVKDNGKEYYFEASGAMATNKWIGKWYVGANGAWDSTVDSANAGKVQKQRLVSPAVYENVLVKPAVEGSPAVYEDRQVLVKEAVEGQPGFQGSRLATFCHTCDLEIGGRAAEHIGDTWHAGYANRIVYFDDMSEVPTDVATRVLTEPIPAIPAQEAVYETQSIKIKDAVLAQQAVYERRLVKEAVYEYYWE